MEYVRRFKDDINERIPNINEVVFPVNQDYRYYGLHYQYIADSIKAAGIKLTFSDKMKEVDGTAFHLQVDGEPVFFDFSDFPNLKESQINHPNYFKFHYSEGLHEDRGNIYPFSPISFYDWNQFEQLKKQISYKANNDLILNKQLPNCGALIRREKVQSILRNAFGLSADFNLVEQEAFWNSINNCLVSVCVPGARNNMLDRGQIQYMAFGCCTIAPKLLTVLPYYRSLVPGRHYIECCSDYSDLVEKVNWCASHKDSCIEIGNNAKQLFHKTSTPKSLWEWVGQVISTNKK